MEGQGPDKIKVKIKVGTPMSFLGRRPLAPLELYVAALAANSARTCASILALAMSVALQSGIAAPGESSQIITFLVLS